MPVTASVNEGPGSFRRFLEGNLMAGLQCLFSYRRPHRFVLNTSARRPCTTYCEQA